MPLPSELQCVVYHYLSYMTLCDLHSISPHNKIVTEMIESTVIVDSSFIDRNFHYGRAEVRTKQYSLSSDPYDFSHHEFELIIRTPQLIIDINDDYGVENITILIFSQLRHLIIKGFASLNQCRIKYLYQLDYLEIHNQCICVPYASHYEYDKDDESVDDLIAKGLYVPTDAVWYNVKTMYQSFEGLLLPRASLKHLVLYNCSVGFVPVAEIEALMTTLACYEKISIIGLRCSKGKKHPWQDNFYCDIVPALQEKYPDMTYLPQEK